MNGFLLQIAANTANVPGAIAGLTPDQQIPYIIGAIAIIGVAVVDPGNIWSLTIWPAIVSLLPFLGNTEKQAMSKPEEGWERTNPDHVIEVVNYETEETMGIVYAKKKLKEEPVKYGIKFEEPETEPLELTRNQGEIPFNFENIGGFRTKLIYYPKGNADKTTQALANEREGNKNLRIENTKLRRILATKHLSKAEQDMLTEKEKGSKDASGSPVPHPFKKPSPDANQGDKL